ncbi:MAG: prenyltransferase [Thiobacillaceae bacterium]
MSATLGTLGAPKVGWWRALNPAIYLVSILPGVAVWQLAGTTDGARYALLAATVAVVLLQHSINVLNDVSDWRLGADAEKWDSWVRAHGENLTLASLHGWLSFLAGGLLGLGVLYLSARLWILAIALPMVGLGYWYNSGKKPLSYTRMGEWVTGLCYGPGVVGCLWLLSGTPIDGRCVLAMTGFAALAVALLFSHQPPQIESDRQAGKHSFAVRFGAQQTYHASRLLLMIFLLAYGLSLGARLDSVVLFVTYCVAAGIAVVAALRKNPNPKLILLLATAVVTLAVIAGPAAALA